MRRVRQTIEFKPEAVQLMKRGQSIVVAAHRLCVVGLDNDVVDFASTLVDANYLGHLTTSGLTAGGQRAAAIMSLIQSARLNGHDPYAYLKEVFTRLPTQPMSRIAGHRARTESVPYGRVPAVGVKMCLPGAYIERGKRLVHQQHARLRRERAGNCHTLFHATGQLVGMQELSERKGVLQRGLELDFGISDDVQQETTINPDVVDLDIDIGGLFGMGRDEPGHFVLGSDPRWSATGRPWHLQYRYFPTARHR